MCPLWCSNSTINPKEITRNGIDFIILLLHHITQGGGGTRRCLWWCRGNDPQSFQRKYFLHLVSWFKSPSYTVPFVGNPPRHMGFPGGTSGKEPSCPCKRHGRHRFDPWAGKIPVKGNGNSLQCSCLENPRDRSLVGYSPQGSRVRHD